LTLRAHPFGVKGEGAWFGAPILGIAKNEINPKLQALAKVIPQAYGSHHSDGKLIQNFD